LQDACFGFTIFGQAPVFAGAVLGLAGWLGFLGGRLLLFLVQSSAQCAFAVAFLRIWNKLDDI
jgi:hypothetical protein